MSIAYVRVSELPATATVCELTCEGDTGPLLLAFHMARHKMKFIGPMNGYKVFTPPLQVINLLEEGGYKVVSSAANQRNFVWTLELDTRSVSQRPRTPTNGSWVSITLSDASVSLPEIHSDSSARSPDKRGVSTVRSLEVPSGLSKSSPVMYRDSVLASPIDDDFVVL